MRKLLMTGATVACLLTAPHLARATAVTFSGSGASGNLSPGSEAWKYAVCSSPGPTDVVWSSPGLGCGFAQYAGTLAVTSFMISFGSVSITADLDAGQINIGNMSACAGGTGGGTTFCSLGTAGLVPWTGSAIGSHGVEFTAPSGTTLTNGSDYFVNVFLTPGTGVSGVAFSGSWSSTPEPASAGLLAAGLAGLGWMRRRRR